MVTKLLIKSSASTELDSKKSTKELQNDKANNEIETPKKRYISPEERQQIVDELMN